MVGSSDLDSFPLMDFEFNQGITQVTDLIMFDTSYFIYIFDSASINLIMFRPDKFGQVYTTDDVSKKIENKSSIYKTRGYSTGDYKVSGDYKYFFLTCETGDATSTNFIRKYQILPSTKDLV